MTTVVLTLTVNNAPAFENYLATNYPDAQFTVSITGNQVTLTTTTVLSTDQQTSLTTLVNAYVDPAIYLQLAYTESMSGISERSNSQVPYDVMSFIFPSTTNIQDGTLLDGLKTVVTVWTDTVQGFSGVTGGTVTIDIYDYTRDFAITSATIDISTQVSTWQTMAAAGATGMVNAYVSQLFGGLYAESTTFDCIWIFRITTSNPLIYARLNGIQKLFYYNI